MTCPSTDLREAAIVDQSWDIDVDGKDVCWTQLLKLGADLFEGCLAQLTRASTSIVLNLAEGAGKHSKADKRRYYLSARGSATESAAPLEELSRLGLLDESVHQAGKEMLVRVVSMLIKLAQNLED